MFYVEHSQKIVFHVEHPSFAQNAQPSPIAGSLLLR